MRPRVTQHLHNHTLGIPGSCLATCLPRGAPIARSATGTSSTQIPHLGNASDYHEHRRRLTYGFLDSRAYNAPFLIQSAPTRPEINAPFCPPSKQPSQGLGLRLEYKASRHPGCRIVEYHCELTSKSKYNSIFTVPGSLSAAFALRGFHSLITGSVLVRRQALLDRIPNIAHSTTTDAPSGDRSAS